MRRIGLAAVLAVFLLVLPSSALGYTDGHLMDDAVMNNVTSMTESQVEELLSRSPCLAHYTETGFHWNGEQWSYGETWSAAKIVFEAGRMWGENPQAILATLQQQEGLLSTAVCEAWKYESAMGYACPDKGECDSKYAGFTKQVLWGAWQLKFDEERSQGHTAWDEDGEIVYAGFMLKGKFARCEGCAESEYSGAVSIDSTVVTLETGATAALYSYTPHLAAGHLFVTVFEEYFGLTVIEEVGPKEPPHEEPKTEPKEEPRPAPEQIHQQVVTPPSSGTDGMPPVSKPAATCIVPRLKHKTLAQAKRLIERAGCKLGSVKRSKRHGRRKQAVVAQSAAPGKKLPGGSKVSLHLA